MANERRAYQVHCRQQKNLGNNKRNANAELEQLATTVYNMAIRCGRNDIAKMASALLKTIAQTGLARDKERQKTEWLNNFIQQMTAQRRK